MKTKVALIKMVLLAGLTFSAVLAKSNSAPATPSVTTETEKTIHDYFKFPRVLIPRVEERSAAQKVEVLFTTGLNGKVNFVLAKTNDPILKNEIEKQFAKLYLAKIKQNVVHSVVLNFKAL